MAMSACAGLLEPAARSLNSWQVKNHRSTSSHFASIGSDKWRYIRYAKGGEELYDEVNDPYEWKNLANDPKYKAVKAELAAASSVVGPAGITRFSIRKCGFPLGLMP